MESEFATWSRGLWKNIQAEFKSSSKLEKVEKSEFDIIYGESVAMNGVLEYDITTKQYLEARISLL